jgi:hypothetical protein
MSPGTLISPAYRSAVRDGFLIQAALLLLASMGADFGLFFAISLRAVVAFWIIAIWVVIRRPSRPGLWDLRFFRFGYLAILPICMVIAHTAHLWRYRW